ncbi:hypothetical protein KJ766_02425 [Patescibacteria group bacterium]|nr:hypothetical protein [Patescibacteria group bacterium]
MKSRTLFSGFLETSNQSLFASSLFGFRVVFGVFLFISACKVLFGWDFLIDFIQPVAGQTAFAFIFAAIGVAFVLGSAVRPMSFVGAGSFIFMCILQFGTEEFCLVYNALFLSLFCLGMAGGLGHLFGLDSFFYSMFEKKRIWKFLFS